MLLKSIKMGDITLPNRICMASLTRQRCDQTMIPNEMMIKYYSLRSKAGFIITECLPISNRSIAFPGQPGIFTKQHIEGWKQVVDQVHKNDGRIYAQIWHAGRACHSSFQNGLQVWAPSAIAPRNKVRRSQLMHEIPHEMNKQEIQEVIQQFKQAAINCKEAGFDGVQLHCGTGYLVDQFLRDSANKRQDEYGGNIINRTKFCLQIIDELIQVYGNGRVGVKISPVARVNDMCDSDPLSLFTYLIQQLDQRNIAFIEMRNDNDIVNYSNYGYPSSKEQISDLYNSFRSLYKGVLIGNMGYTPETANQNIEKNIFDAVTFGKLFISNPDLVKRIEQNYPLNYNWDEHTFYTQGEKGYLDYPLYEQ